MVMHKSICTILISVLTVQVSFAQKETANTHSGDTLPPPYATSSSMNFSDVIGWKEGEMPVAPEGFAVTKYADSFQNPRWMYVLPNGDVLVAESNTPHSFFEKVGAAIIGANKSNNMRKSANRITLLRDTDKDGKPDMRTTFLKDLNLPFGMLLLKDKFYVANTDGLWMYHYQKGETSITSEGKKILDLPASITGIGPGIL